ncbi:MAG: group 1 truncated hemoglobin [Pseudomonadales bacterium]
MNDLLKNIVSCALILILAACASQAQQSKSLYDELGRKPGVEALVDAFLVRLAADEVIVDQFADTDIDQFREHLVNQICELAAGDCVYEGRTMAESHRDLAIDSRQFNALVADLMLAMDDVAIPQGAQNELLAMLAPMHRDIVIH